jgi:hypothetical protein
MRLRLGPPRWWSGWQVTLRLGEARLAGPDAAQPADITRASGPGK